MSAPRNSLIRVKVWKLDSDCTVDSVQELRTQTSFKAMLRHKNPVNAASRNGLGQSAETNCIRTACLLSQASRLGIETCEKLLGRCRPLSSPGSESYTALKTLHTNRKPSRSCWRRRCSAGPGFRRTNTLDHISVDNKRVGSIGQAIRC